MITLQRLVPAQWEAYKAIRLEALHTDPGMFGSKYAKEAAYTPEDWMAFLADESRALFGLYDGATLVGLSGVTLKKDNVTIAVLVSSYIRAPYRGRGLSRWFYEARILWAREQQCRWVEVSHRAGNLASAAANRAFGFRYSHAQAATWPDGTAGDALFYYLELLPEAPDGNNEKQDF